jgi:hypothetical protein
MWLSLRHSRGAIIASASANAGLLPERVEKAAQEGIAAAPIGIADGDKSDVVLSASS